jgi:branched-chain amino acid transport system ATP-binding protein
MLAVENLTLRFGGLLAVNDVSFDVREGEIFAIIGPNGAGKTSLFNAISGVYEPTDGKVLLNGEITHRNWTTQHSLLAVLSGIFFGLGLMLLVNINSLWQAAIIDQMSAGTFTWRGALNSILTLLFALPWYEGILPLLLGLFFGSFGLFSIWSDTRRGPDFVAKCGMARTFQNIRLFPTLSVKENLMVGMDGEGSVGILHAILRTPRVWQEEKQNELRAQKLLEFVSLTEYANALPSNLPYGHQRRLEIARALATSPKLLLLDEPAAGMNPSESQALMELIKKIRRQGTTVLLIEHHMKVVMGISDRILVLHHGNRIALGTPQEIRSNEQVVEAYLGKGHQHE